MVSPEPKKPEELEPEEGSVKMTLQDVYVLFYLLVKQNQTIHPDSKMSFDLRVFKNMPKKLSIFFERKHGRLFAWIPKKKKEKSRLYLPDNEIITQN